MNQQLIRQTAYKVRIADLNRNNYVINQGEWEPNYIEISGKRVSRVNIICTIISKYEPDESNYISLTLDDGTSTIQAKAWSEDVKKLQETEIGDLVLVIGKVKKYNDSIYLTPEIVKRLDNPNWVKLRKKELDKEYGEIKPAETVTESIPEEPPKNSQEDRQLIINTIDKLNSPDGVEIVQIIKESKLSEEKTNSIILDLLKEGEIFEIKPGFIKLVE